MTRIKVLFAGVAGAAAVVVAGCAAGGGPRSATVPAAAQGGSWVVVRAPEVHGVLTAVSCPSPSSCAAVGEYYHPAPRYALIEHWNGSAWSIVKGPPPSAHLTAGLSGVSCSGVSDCTAVGSSTRIVPQPTTGPPPVRTLVEHWNGSAWSIVKSPNPPAASNRLTGVACSRAWGCMAVGQSGGSMNLHVRTLAERWNRSRWVIVKSPTPRGAIYSVLSSISCTRRSDCVAVGEYLPGGQRQSQNHPLIEHWNGSVWTLMPSPQPPRSIASYLSAVSCRSASDCAAVGTVRYPHRKGSSYGGPREYTFIERWDGSAWSIVKSPNPSGPPADGLDGIACPAASDCVAVGAGGNPATPTAPALWSSAGTALAGPSCPAPARRRTVASARSHTLIEHWNRAPGH